MACRRSLSFDLKSSSSFSGVSISGPFRPTLHFNFSSSPEPNAMPPSKKTAKKTAATAAAAIRRLIFINFCLKKLKLLPRSPTPGNRMKPCVRS
jgi:hypothetical protein